MQQLRRVVQVIKQLLLSAREPSRSTLNKRYIAYIAFCLTAFVKTFDKRIFDVDVHNVKNGILLLPVSSRIDFYIKW